MRIKSLTERGLPTQVQKALDIVRITANEGGSHCGQIDLTGADREENVDWLFWLVNFVIEKVITEPRIITEKFDSLPAEKKDGVKKRDIQNHGEKNK